MQGTAVPFRIDMRGKNFRAVQAGQRTNAEGKQVSNKVLLATPDNEYELMRADLMYIDLPDHLSLHEPTYRMRMGVQPFRADRWPIDRRDEDALRTATRPGVRIPRLRRAPESHKKPPLAKSLLSTVPSDFCAQFLDRIKGTQILLGALTGGQRPTHFNFSFG